MGFIFDMGNVLSLEVDVVPRVAERLGMTVEKLVAYGRRDFEALMTGAMTAEEFWERFNRHFGTDVREDLLTAFFHPVTDRRVERLIIDLKAAGQRVVCGSNTFERHYLYHLEHGEYAVFDKVYASHLMEVAKPSPVFYERILEQEGWRAEDAYFIDDREANVAAARKLGIRSLLYESYEGLEAWLAERTLLPAR